MGDVIRVDFNSGKVVDSNEVSDSLQEANNLREIGSRENASREDLMEGAAFVAAHLELAKVKQDRLEIQDLEKTMRECFRALGPNVSDAEVEAIFRRSSQIISDLMAS